MKKKSGVGRRFVILLVVYVMLLAPFLEAISSLLPFSLDQTWKKLLVAGCAVFLYVAIFIFVEYLNDRKRVK